MKNSHVCSHLAVVLVVTVLGCTTAPSQEEFAAADFGPYPEEFREIIESSMRMRLKDPNSADYQWGRGPQRAWNGLGGRMYGWAICLQINAKNNYGGYTGFKQYYFLIRDGRIARDMGGGDEYRQAMTRGACNGLSS